MKKISKLISTVFIIIFVFSFTLQASAQNGGGSATGTTSPIVDPTSSATTPVPPPAPIPASTTTPTTVKPRTVAPKLTMPTQTPILSIPEVPNQPIPATSNSFNNLMITIAGVLGLSVLGLFGLQAQKGIKNVLIFHGTEGYPEENWFPWLKAKLEEKGYRVFVPQFPTPPVVASKLTEWFEVLKNYEQYMNEDTIIVGHSLGGTFTLKVLEKLKHPVKAVFLVGTAIGVKPIFNYDRDLSFSGFSFDWGKLKSNSKRFVVYHSDNDPYVDFENGKKLARELGVELSFIPNAGHFNTKAGYTKFEELLDQF